VGEIQQRLQSRVGLALKSPSLGDISADRHRRYDLSLTITNRRATQVHGNELIIGQAQLQINRIGTA